MISWSSSCYQGLEVDVEITARCRLCGKKGFGGMYCWVDRKKGKHVKEVYLVMHESRDTKYGPLKLLCFDCGDKVDDGYT